MPNPHPLFDHENFHFEKIRQKIIAFAIHNNGKLSHAEMKKCRLINWDWLRVTTYVLQQFNEPLFHLLLDKDHTFDGSRYWTHQNMELNIPVGIPLAVNFRSGCLENLKNIVVELMVSVEPKTSWNVFPADCNFPVLQSLSIEFTKDTQERGVSIQPILNSCPALKKLAFPSGPRVFNNAVMPVDFSRVILPSALTVIDLSTKIENEHLQVLSQSPLPNLKRLTLLICLSSPFATGLVFSVLDNIKRSLEYLFIQGEDHNGTPVPPTYFSFPTMEKLTQLGLESQHFELEMGVLPLETVLPKLLRLRLMLQTNTMIWKWTNSNSRLSSVSDLYVTMTNDFFNHAQPEYHVNLDERTTKQIAQMFPQVKEFVMDFHHKKYEALREVWKGMHQIEWMSVYVGSSRKVDEDVWTSILLGDLKSFNVGHMRYGRSNGNENRLLSDAVFENALLRMPNLQSMTLGKKYWASPEMTHLWKESGRQINYDQNELYRRFKIWE